MATVPAKPSKLTASAITDDSVHLHGVDPNNGGSAITGRRMLGARYGSLTVTSHLTGLDYTWTGLQSGFRYDFWWRVSNAIGSSPDSDKISITTLRVPDAPVAPTLSDIQQTTFRASYPDPYDGGTGIFNRQIGITTSPSALPTVGLAYHGALFDLYGTTGFGGPLNPGGTYYVRARVANSVGFSPWGSPTTLVLIAGAWVKSGGIWRRAVPYVRDGGVWKLARPQGRILGIWEETG